MEKFPAEHAAAPSSEEVFERGDIEVTVSRHPIPSDWPWAFHDVPIALTERGSACEITIRSTTGSEVRLTDLLPSGWMVVGTPDIPSAETFWRSKVIFMPETVAIAKLELLRSDYDRFYAGGRTSQSRMPEERGISGLLHETHDYWKMDGSLLVLLHEIGHAHEPEQSYSARAQRAKLQQPGYFAFTAFTKGEILNMSDPQIEEYLTLVLQPERDASAYAFREYRRLLQSGIDIEPNMELEDILSQTHRALGSYLSLHSKKPDTLEQRRRENRTAKERKI